LCGYINRELGDLPVMGEEIRKKEEKKWVFMSEFYTHDDLIEFFSIHTGTKVLILSKKVTFGKYQFSQNSHLENINFHKIHF